MKNEIRVPNLGESVNEATLAQWYKRVGEAVALDEPLCELETDKVSVEVPALAAGVLQEVTAKEGDNVEVGALLGVIDGAGAAAEKPASTPEPTPSPPPNPTPTPSPTPTPATQELSPDLSPDLSPAVRRMVAEHALDPATIKGTGKGGRITKADVTQALKSSTSSPASKTPAPTPPPRTPTPPAPLEGGEERVKMTRLRQTIARRLKESQETAAQLTTFNEVDMSALISLRRDYKDLFEKKYGVRLGYMSFFVRACVIALQEIPSVNAEIEGDEIIYKPYVNMGVAVGTDKGLVVPVVRGAHAFSLAEIEAEIAALGARARDGSLALGDLQGGTFTISNGGVYGSLMSTPILNTPQSGILGMHKIEERPVVVAGEIVVRPMMYLALSYDHRLVDGKEAVTFLVRVKECLESPERLLLDL